MKNKIILLTLGIFFVLLTIPSINNPINNDTQAIESDQPERIIKLSAAHSPIHIDNNWSAAVIAGIATGFGTYRDPYVIANYEIDGGGSGSCILIENSNVYFKVENCTVYNSGTGVFNAGITLKTANNGQLINNDCSNNNIYGEGIYLWYSDNNTVSGNTANDNWYGINIAMGHYNTISGNTINDNSYGLGIVMGHYNTISGNTINDCRNGINLERDNIDCTLLGNLMNGCGIRIWGSLEEMSSYNIDTTNLVNGKPVYYYANETSLKTNNFSNAGQVLLVNCNDSMISNIDISNLYEGISLFYCNNNTVSGNTANNNERGIVLSSSINNNVTGNTANNNSYGILLQNSNHSIITKNTANNNDCFGIAVTHSNNNTVSGNIANNNEDGILLQNSNHSIITENTANYNSHYGIYLLRSNYNTVSRNTLIDNGYGCIYEDDECVGNVIENNDCGEEEAPDNLWIILLIIFVCVGVASIAIIFIVMKKRKV